MKMINTSECEECFHGSVIGESNRLKVYCSDREKSYWYGQCISCENKKRRSIENEESSEIL